MLDANSSRIRLRPVQLLLLTMALSLCTVVLLDLVVKFSAEGAASTSLFEVLILALTCGNIATLWFSMMTMTQTREASLELSSCMLIGFGGAVLGTLELIAANHPLPESWYFHVNVLAQVVQVLGIGFLVTHGFQLKGRWAIYLTGGCTSIVLLAAAAALLGQSWRPLADSALSLSALAQGTIVLLPLVLTSLCMYAPSIRLHPKSAWESLRMRLSPREGHRAELVTMALLVASALTLTMLNILAFTSVPSFFVSKPFPRLPLSALTFAWIPAIIYCYTRINDMYDRYQEHFLLARFSGTGAKRFVRRNYSEEHAWAATVGLRTACFLIDHDPDDSVGQQLPATLYQIRNDEIYRCVVEVLGAGSLHSRVVGNRIMGSIDPESSLRPCMDVLSMFACLYLDAMPLIERRLKGLAALLPIIDPQLAFTMNNADITKTWRRNLWLFHFEFDWADQHIVNTPKYTRYEVYMNDVPASVRAAVFDHLQKKNRLGNFIWVGEKARNRIIEEAPLLASIIESWPVPLPHSNDEILVFLIKFEELVPRLQKYFNLDRLRTLLRDFDPSTESNQYLNIVDLQMLQSRTPEDIMKILDTLTNYPWRGFREKDQALHTVIKAYGLVKQYYESAAVNDPTLMQKIQNKFISAVASIGYPSQILHLAQLRKFHLRDPDKVISAARSQGNPRFHEAWLIMSTTGTNRYTSTEVRVFLDFLHVVPSEPQLRRNIFVLGKALAAWVNFGREFKDPSPQLLANIANRYAEWLVQLEAGPDICTYFLDCKIFLEGHLNTHFDFEPAAAQKLADYFNFLRQTHGATSPEIAAIAARWQLMAAQNPPTAA